MQTIVELPEYLRQADQILSPEERAAIAVYLALHPCAGVLIQGTGGVRKLRWAVQSKGKSGGLRVIYYFHNQSLPLFLLTLFSKSDKVNLSKAERNQFAKLIYLILQNYGH